MGLNSTRKMTESDRIESLLKEVALLKTEVAEIQTLLAKLTKVVMQAQPSLLDNRGVESRIKEAPVPDFGPGSYPRSIGRACP